MSSLVNSTISGSQESLKNEKYKWKYYDKFYLSILVVKYLIRFIGIAQKIN